MIIIMMLVFSAGQVWAADVDSLKQELKSTEERATLDILNELSKAYRLTDPPKSLRFGELAVDLAKSLRHSNGEARANENIGYYYWNQRDYRMALDHINAALQLYEQAGNVGGIALSYNNLGRIYEDLSQNDQALESHLRALMIFEDIDDQNNVAATVSMVGDIYQDWQQSEKALRFHERALEIYRVLPADEGTISTLNRLGHIYLARGDFEDADTQFRESLQLAESNADSLNLATMLASMGELAEEQGQFQIALEYQTRALVLKRIFDTPVNIANSILHIGQIYQQAGDFSKAIQNFNEAVTVLEASGSQRALANSLQKIGAAYARAQDYTQATSYLQRGLKTAQGIEAQDVVQECYRLLADVYSRTGKEDLAVSFLQSYQATRDEIHEQQSNRRLAQLEIIYELDKKNKELDLLKQKNLVQELDYRKKANLLVSILTFSIVISLLFVGFLIYRQRLIRNAEREKVENMLKMKADFTAMLVHDLRSPLTSVFGYSELLKMGNKEPSKIKEIASTITQASQKMLLLVNEMLDFSKFEAGKMTINKESVNLKTTISQSIQMLKPIAEQKQTTVDFIYQEDLPKCMCDPRKMEQVITNLLGNAIKHTPESTKVIIRLKVIDDLAGQAMEFSVEDDGPGINQEFQDTIFDKYAQLEQKNEALDLGTGLGLAVSKMIIDAHGGQIGYRTGDPKGSIFYFRLAMSPVTVKSEEIS